MNRRNVLVGLGGIVAGGGALLGTGAFSSVEAHRTIDIETTGDSDALLSFEINRSALEPENGDGNQIEISIDDLNENAVTQFDDALTVGNNGDNEVELEVTDAPKEVRIEHEGNDLSETEVAIDSEADEDFDIVFDLEGEEDVDVSDGTITFEANAT
ncbi:hypothetical protein [Halovivax sp.]|uniref:hypothetical protein n=1 Tax=Halovivax sp. TaxID=1935978 RepID=UPI0025C3EE95|nr:hypothetical protein [Halovivax sp.]